LGHNGVAKLSAALSTNSTVTTLNLGFNNLGDEGAAMVAAGLEKNVALTSLELSSNNIRLVGAQALARALTTNTSLRTLNLALNNFLNTPNNQGAKAFEQALALNQTLCELKGVRGVVELTARNQITNRKRVQAVSRVIWDQVFLPHLVPSVHVLCWLSYVLASGWAQLWCVIVALVLPVVGWLAWRVCVMFASLFVAGCGVG
jgi:hypothetical protein